MREESGEKGSWKAVSRVVRESGGRWGRGEGRQGLKRLEEELGRLLQDNEGTHFATTDRNGRAKTNRMSRSHADKRKIVRRDSLTPKQTDAESQSTANNLTSRHTVTHGASNRIFHATTQECLKP